MQKHTEVEAGRLCLVLHPPYDAQGLSADRIGLSVCNGQLCQAVLVPLKGTDGANHLEAKGAHAVAPTAITTCNLDGCLLMNGNREVMNACDYLRFFKVRAHSLFRLQTPEGRHCPGKLLCHVSEAGFSRPYLLTDGVWEETALGWEQVQDFAAAGWRIIKRRVVTMPEGQVTRLVACDAQLSDLYNPTGTPTEELIAFMTKASQWALTNTSKLSPIKVGQVIRKVQYTPSPASPAAAAGVGTDAGQQGLEERVLQLERALQACVQQMHHLQQAQQQERPVQQQEHDRLEPVELETGDNQPAPPAAVAVPAPAAAAAVRPGLGGEQQTGEVLQRLREQLGKRVQAEQRLKQRQQQLDEKWKLLGLAGEKPTAAAAAADAGTAPVPAAAAAAAAVAVPGAFVKPTAPAPAANVGKAPATAAMAAAAVPSPAAEYEEEEFFTPLDKINGYFLHSPTAVCKLTMPAAGDGVDSDDSDASVTTPDSFFTVKPKKRGARGLAAQAAAAAGPVAAATAGVAASRAAAGALQEVFFTPQHQMMGYLPHSPIAGLKLAIPAAADGFDRDDDAGTPELVIPAVMQRRQQTAKVVAAEEAAVAEGADARAATAAAGAAGPEEATLAPAVAGAEAAVAQQEGVGVFTPPHQVVGFPPHSPAEAIKPASPDDTDGYDSDDSAATPDPVVILRRKWKEAATALAAQAAAARAGPGAVAQRGPEIAGLAPAVAAAAMEQHPGEPKTQEAAAAAGAKAAGGAPEADVMGLTDADEGAVGKQKSGAVHAAAGKQQDVEVRDQLGDNAAAAAMEDLIKLTGDNQQAAAIDADEKNRREPPAAAAPAPAAGKHQAGEVRVHLDDNAAVLAAAPAAAVAAVDGSISPTGDKKNAAAKLAAADLAAAARAAAAAGVPEYTGPAVDCPICFDSTEGQAALQLGCDHVIHAACLAQYLQTEEALHKDTNQYVCPMCKATAAGPAVGDGQQQQQPVGWEISSNHIAKLTLLGALTVEQEERINRQQIRRAAGAEHSCIHCDMLLDLEPGPANAPDAYMVKCGACNTQQCVACGKLWSEEHAKHTCTQMRAMDKNADTATRVMLSNTVVCAGGCGHGITKDERHGDSCNVMRCQRCRVYTCFLCGDKLDSSKFDVTDRFHREANQHYAVQGHPCHDAVWMKKDVWLRRQNMELEAAAAAKGGVPAPAAAAAAGGREAAVVPAEPRVAEANPRPGMPPALQPIAPRADGDLELLRRMAALDKQRQDQKRVQPNDRAGLRFDAGNERRLTAGAQEPRRRLLRPAVKKKKKQAVGVQGNQQPLAAAPQQAAAGDFERLRAAGKVFQAHMQEQLRAQPGNGLELAFVFGDQRQVAEALEELRPAVKPQQQQQQLQQQPADAQRPPCRCPDCQKMQPQMQQQAAAPQTDGKQPTAATEATAAAAAAR